MSVAHESLKVFGLLSVLSGLMGPLVMLLKYPPKKDHSISKHAAQTKFNFWWMAATEFICVPLFIVFVVGWLVPHFHLPVLFSVASLYSGFGLLAAALIPATEGRQNTIHELLAYSAAFIFIIPLVIIAFSSQLLLFPRIIAALSSIYMICNVGLFFFFPAAKKYHLIFQSIYIASFDISLLVLAYWK